MQRRRTNLTHAEKLAIVDMRRRGARLYEIGRHFGFSEATIRAVIKASGMPLPQPKPWSRKKRPIENVAPIMVDAPEPKQLPPSNFYNPTATEIARLKAKGLGNTKIAALLKLPYRVVEGVPAQRQG